MKLHLSRSSRVAAGLFVVIAITATAGCASDAGSSASMTFAGFGGVTQDAQFETQVQPFGEKFEVEVVQDQPADYAKLKLMVESQNISWDVLDIDPFFVIANCGTLFEPIDLSVVDVSDIPEDLVTECGIPAYLSANMVFYNTEKHASAPTSWADFFDIQAFPGKRGVPKSAQYGLIEGALLADGVAPESLYPLDVERALRFLDPIRDSFVFWDSGAQQQQQMESGEVDLMLGWPGRAHGAAVNGAPFAPAWDATIFIYDAFAITKDSPNKDTAMEFVNFAIGAGPQSAFADLVPYASINLKSTPSTDPLISVFAPTLQKREEYNGVSQDQGWWGENMDATVKTWTAWVAG